MVVVIKFKDGKKEIWHVVKLVDLVTEIKLTLGVQLRELINEIEDHENDLVSIGSVRDVQFLDQCYLAA